MGYYGHGWVVLVPFAVAIVMRMVSGRRRSAAGGPVGQRGFQSGAAAPPHHHHPGPAGPTPTIGTPGAGLDTPGSAAPERSGLGRSGLAPGWFPDPTGRFQQRYWSGSDWTEHVSSGGVPATDQPPPSLRSNGPAGPEPGDGSPGG